MNRILLFSVGTFLLLGHLAHAQGPAFTYQGRLAESNVPANGYYDLSFRLFNADVGGDLIGVALTNSATLVSNGLFAVTLDFGEVFDGDSRWLQVSVRTNDGGAFVVLNSRQPLNASPYAITAKNVSGPVPAGQLIGPLPGGTLSGTYTGAVSFANPGGNFAGNTVSAVEVIATNSGTFGSVIVNTNLQFGTNAGYVASFPSVSGLLGPTNLGFNFNRSATWWDLDKPPDEVMMWGYNISPGGGLADARDSALGFSLEGNYNTLGLEYTEAHLLYVDKSGTQWRPWSWRIDKSTNYWDWQQLIHASKFSIFPPVQDIEYFSLAPDQFLYRLAPGYTNGFQIYEIGGGTPGIQFRPSGGAANPQLWLAAWDQVVTPVGTMKQTSFDMNQSLNVANRPINVEDALGNTANRMDPGGLTLSTNTSIRFALGPNVFSPLNGQIYSAATGVVGVGPNLAVTGGLGVGGVARFSGSVVYSFSAQFPNNSPATFIADFAANYRTITATNDVAFAYATNLPTGGTNVFWAVIKVIASGADRTFSAPTNWHWMSLGGLSLGGGVYSVTIPNGKRAWLSLYADGGLQDDVSASWTQEP